MKKNAMLKIAAILMVAVLLTTCAISSTFAKYVSSDQTESTARVAKWGVKVDISANNTAFGKTYKLGDNAVVASETFVVAPGTSNEKAIVINLTGKPEVDATLLIDDLDKDDTTNNFVILSNWGDKCPLQFKIGSGDWISQGESKLTDFQTAVNTAISDAFKNVTIEANQATDINKSVTIGWKWTYEVSDDQDAIDSALGNQAAGMDAEGNPIEGTVAAPEVSIKFKATITQYASDNTVVVTETVAP